MREIRTWIGNFIKCKVNSWRTRRCLDSVFLCLSVCVCACAQTTPWDGTASCTATCWSWGTPSWPSGSAATSISSPIVWSGGARASHGYVHSSIPQPNASSSVEPPCVFLPFYSAFVILGKPLFNGKLLPIEFWCRARLSVSLHDLGQTGNPPCLLVFKLLWYAYVFVFFTAFYLMYFNMEQKSSLHSTLESKLIQIRVLAFSFSCSSPGILHC